MKRYQIGVMTIFCIAVTWAAQHQQIISDWQKRSIVAGFKVIFSARYDSGTAPIEADRKERRSSEKVNNVSKVIKYSQNSSPDLIDSKVVPATMACLSQEATLYILLYLKHKADRKSRPCVEEVG